MRTVLFYPVTQCITYVNSAIFNNKIITTKWLRLFMPIVDVVSMVGEVVVS
ncbi:hypothetical protein VHP8226_03075 [Vibrio hippocampi]|uniref:Uncharacterized protein n=1 Tax=Vibrio hippocampi TaxID=654686 RepID=A0ABN8DLN5_9VIBR|nr:hypothetical protein VHP8226_03075 [Vibrio hippocampi]